MRVISRLAFVAAVAAAIGVAGPVFAQSFDPEAGAGNITQIAMHKARHHSVAVGEPGLNAFGMIPPAGIGSVFSPAATGGGSAGYNENLRRDAW